MQDNETELRATLAAVDAKPKSRSLLFFASARLAETDFWPSGAALKFETHVAPDWDALAAELAASSVDLAKQLVCLVLDEKTILADYLVC
jgi:hypothetical protein